MGLFISIFASKPSSVSLQLHPQDNLCTSFQAKWIIIKPFRLKFAQTMDKGLEFQKTSLRIRINILEILSLSLCLYVCVCVCVNFDQIFKKIDLGLEILKTNVGI